MRTAWNVLQSVMLMVLAATLSSPRAARASITSFDWNQPIILKLKDGRLLSGHFHGELGFAENEAYSERYEAWLGSVGTQAAPALGESLIVARQGAPPIRGAFCGFADEHLLLGTADSCIHVVVSLGGHVEVRRAGEEAPDPDWLAARKLWKSAPSLHAIALKSDSASTAVPVALIA